MMRPITPLERYTLQDILYAGLLVILAFNDFFQYSGYAYNLDWSSTICYMAWAVFFWYVVFAQKGYLRIVVTLLWTVFFCHMFFYSKPFEEQLLTVTPLLTAYALTLTLSKLRWTSERLQLCGVCLLVYVLIMLVSLQPGHIFSGWNPNSPIILTPSLLCGIAMTFVYGGRKIKLLTMTLTIMCMWVIASLENRSSVLCIVAFLAVTMSSIYKKNLTVFRITYISLIVFNLLTPFLWDNLPFYDLLEGISADMFNKSVLMNGRQDLWPQVLETLSRQDIIWGYGGRRLIYSHNLSLDTFSCAGIAGYCLYITSIIFLLEKGFKAGSKNNIFLYGFLMLLVMNTFENVMVCNNTYMVFQYMLLAIPISLNFKAEEIK